jgi:hypothetical protein
VKQRDPVAYVGADDAELMLWNGQPGRVVAVESYPRELVVAFVNGPTLCLSPEDVAELDPETYRERAQRVLRLAHPVREDAAIPQFWAELRPWDDESVR